MNESPFPAGWRDSFGNTVGMLINSAEWGIRRAEENRCPFRYDPDLFHPLMIKEAVRNIEKTRGYGVEPAPIPATPEDLMWQELPLLIEIFVPSDHPVARENARASRMRIQQIEARYPGTIARIESANPGTLAHAGLAQRATAA